MMTKESTKLRHEIRRVSLEVWDPIRINDEPNAQDEYDRYIDPIARLLSQDGTDKQILGQLLWATERMGMDGSRASLRDVVATLRGINLPRQFTAEFL